MLDWTFSILYRIVGDATFRVVVPGLSWGAFSILYRIVGDATCIDLGYRRWG